MTPSFFSFRVFLFTFLLFSGTTSNAASDVLKRVGSMPMKLVLAGEGETLVMQSPPTPQFYLWKPGLEEPQLVRPRADLRADAVQLAWSAKRRTLIVRQGLFAPATSLHLVDLAAPSLQFREVPETRAIAEVPILSPQEDQMAFFESIPSGQSQSWLFPLEEYLWDLKQQTQQPTGFYLRKLGPALQSGRFSGGAFSMDGSRLALLQASGTSGVVRGGLSPFAPEPAPGGAAVQVLELLGGEGALPQEAATLAIVSLPAAASQAQWVSFHELLAWQPGGHLMRVRIDEKKADFVVPHPLSDIEVSPDGRFAWVLPLAAGPRKWQLLDLKHPKAHSFEGASGGSFSPDSQHLIVSRKEVPSGEPFVQISLQRFKDAASHLAVDVEKENAPQLGRGLPVYAAPKTRPEFEAHLQLKDVRPIQLVNLGWDLHMTLQNTSKHVLQLDTQAPLGLVCQLIDEQGKTLVEWSPEDNQSQAETTLRLNPGEEKGFDCGATVEQPLAVGFRGKIQFALREYEEATRGEIAVP